MRDKLLKWTTRTTEIIAIVVLLVLNAQGAQGQTQPAPAAVKPVAFGGDCASLGQRAFAGMYDGSLTITSTEIVAAGKGLPEYCRVTGVIGPGKIQFELRMPTKTWNGRLLAQGSGGSGGTV